MDYKPTLYLIRGLPGSGKSYLAETMKCCLQHGNSCGHYEADMYFTYNKHNEYIFELSKLKDAHAWCFDLAHKCIATKNDCIVSNTFTTRKELQPYLDMAKEYGANVQLITCQGNFGSIHNVPEETIARMKARWEHIEL